MGKRIQDKECAISNGNSSHHTHPGRVWGILHVIKYHHWRHVKRRLTHRRHGGGRHDDARVEIPGSSDDSGVHTVPLSNVEEKLVQSNPPAKQSIKSRLRSLLNDDIYKKGRHKRSSTCPAKSQMTPAETVHHLEVDPLSELLLTVDSPEPVLETFQNHLAAGTLDVLSPVFSEKPNANNDKCVACGTMFSSNILEHSKSHKHLSSPNQGMPEEKLMNAKIVTTDAAPHLFKDFLDALDVINTNKDFLLKYIQDPGSPLPFHSPGEQFSKCRPRRSKSISFPVSGSSSGSKDAVQGQLINQMVDDLFKENRERQLQVQAEKPSKDFRQQALPSSSSHTGANQELSEKDHNSSQVSSHAPTNVKTRHFRDLRKKMKYIIEEGRNEKYRITMDAILDKIPRGKKLTKNVKKLMQEQSKDPTIKGEGEDSAANGFGSRISSNSLNKRQLPPMRTSSLKESVGRYSQLYETCFHSDAKYPKTENLKVKTEEKNSLKTPKSFKRVLSMPNLKSHFHQNEELSIFLSPQNSFGKFGDRNICTSFNDHQRMFDHSDDLKSQLQPPTFVDNKHHESGLNADQKQLLVRSASKSGIDFSNEAKADTSIGIDALANLKDSELEFGTETESNTMPVEVNSVFSSDTSFLDVAFDLENMLEESNSELQPGSADGLDNMVEQQEAKMDHPSELQPGSADGLDNMVEQQEAKMDHPEEVEDFFKLGTPSKHFNYEIPFIEVDASNEAAFNYVRKVLELSGFTGHESLGIWFSDDQPLDPSVYEELEGCLLLDPDCSGNSDEGGECNHLLLFDIINEGLLEIFGRSFNYYPKPLSSLSHVHPLPAGGDNVLNKVWSLITWYLNSTTSELYPSLDSYVSKDLAKYDGWMNLQFDSECVGLELDDLIFDDLLEEIIYD